MNINNKNIYYQGNRLLSDSLVKDKIEDTFKIHPAYGHRRLAMDLQMNKKKILRIMHKFGLKPPRLWYQKKYITLSATVFQTQYINLLKDADLSLYNIGEVWSSDLTYSNVKTKYQIS